MKVECIAFSEGQNAKTYVTIEERMKPLLVSMKLFGIYFDPKQDDNTSGQLQNGRKRIPTRILAFIGHRQYCYMVLLLLWINFFRVIVGIFPPNETLPFRVLNMSWYLQCTLNVSVMVFSCQKLSQLRSFYNYWDSLYKHNVTNQIGCGFKCPVKYLMFATSGGWVLFFINIAAAFTILFGNLSTSKDFLDDMLQPFPEETWAVALQIILHVISSGAWVFPVIFLAVISRIIKDQFFIFRRILSKQIQEAGDHIPHCLPELRSRYMQLCEAVIIINRTFKWILGTSFFLQVFMACFNLYQMINRPQEMFTLFANSFWLGSGALIIILLTRSSSDVHEAAHSLLEDIFHTGTKNATTELLGQLNLFVSSLTGRSTGFTVVDFFVIKKEFLLTMAGLFITYFFLLLQFKI
ncbi:gustatory receptor for sugar taste 64a-like [Haliotis asinina]|uniref:gustatory receptor for sugar taste 64a-like n=1 Tax=Haliotis asinina TaxID=109174 RepID=UPI0035320CBE